MLERDDRIQAAFETSLQEAACLIRAGRSQKAWPALERAHVLGQADAWRHLRSHWWMLRCGLSQADAREIGGQLVRLALAAPASALGRYPIGNTGRATVGLFSPMPISPELAAIVSRPRTDDLL